MIDTPLYYTGKTRSAKRHPDSASQPEAYVPSPELVEAVQLALHLKRPLLLEGEPGCGKTRLAYAVADELGIPIEAWPINSTTRVSEGLYHYDALLRMHDIQLVRNGIEASVGTGRDPSDPMAYVKLGPFGRALARRGTRSVLLIDEIDKAEMDFANDLLALLDRDSQRFTILEADQIVEPERGSEPIIVITSNRERGTLPDPLLRRCVYQFVKFPSPEQLSAIVERHYVIRGVDPPVRSTEVIEKFYPLRQGLAKPPGTSEFLDWLNVLETFPNGHGSDRLSESVPYSPVLIKTLADLQKLGLLSR